MTKLRQPTTFADATTRVADRIGFAACADIVGKGERVIRNWSDPDMDRCPTFDEALALDMAYLDAGGGDPPFFAVYAARLERRLSPAADSAEIARATGAMAKEAGEAIAASVAASMPGADQRMKVVAEKELDDAIDAMQGLKTKLGAGTPGLRAVA